MRCVYETTFGLGTPDDPFVNNYISRDYDKCLVGLNAITKEA
jgi:hypothetical protein